MNGTDAARDGRIMRLDRLLSGLGSTNIPSPVSWLSEGKPPRATSMSLLERLMPGLTRREAGRGDESQPPQTELDASPERSSLPVDFELEARVASVEMALRAQTALLGKFARAGLRANGSEGTGETEMGAGPAVFRRRDLSFSAAFPVPRPSVFVEAVSGAAPTTFYDSRIDKTRRHLIAAFGAAADDLLIGQVVALVKDVRLSGTALSKLVDEVVAGRWIAEQGVDAPLSDMATQLRALAAFVSQQDASSRNSTELSHANDLAVQLRLLNLGGTSISGVNLNGLMAVMAAHAMPAPEVAKALKTPDGRTQMLRRAVLDVSGKVEFSGILSREDKDAIRADVPDLAGLPLLALLLWQDGASVQTRFDVESPDGRKNLAYWLWNQGVWRAGLAHLAGADVVEQGRLRISGGTLMVPSHLEDAWNSAVSRVAATPKTRAAVEDVVVRYGAISPEAIDGSIFEQSRPTPLTLMDTQGRPGRRLSRPNHVIGFGIGGLSDNHTLGRHWSSSESDHRWTVGHSAVLAFDLDRDEAASALDLHLAFHLGLQPDQRVTLRWNGRIVWRQHVTAGALHHAQAYLGREHRWGVGPNILTISNASLFLPSLFGITHDSRSLGVAVRSLVFSPR